MQIAYDDIRDDLGSHTNTHAHNSTQQLINTTHKCELILDFRNNEVLFTNAQPKMTKKHTHVVDRQDTKLSNHLAQTAFVLRHRPNDEALSGSFERS